ncbi:MAG: GTPase ObgE [Actinobacteria bacterium]|nr:GTPase ObgE [Actinomycetota bacterium]
MLTDRARIFVQAGRGGDGAVSFRREAHVPKGGPDGGDGGRGAEVALVCDASLRDLQAFRRRSHFKAARGGHGQGSNRHGASPPALEVPVPPGTSVVDTEHGARWDLTQPGQRAVVARGGSGGRGNRRFTTATRQAPRFAERGLPGDEWWIELRLRLLADVGLVGLPNAGKSSLLARLTRAHPKVADYPFTTVEPVLGTLQGAERQLVLADIPGLIEGASGGAGLGHEFLAHVERTRLLVHVVDLAPVDGSDPAANLETVERELADHGAGLEGLDRIVALSKADLLPAERAEEIARGLRRRLRDGVPDRVRVRDLVVTSAATGQGLDGLSEAIFAAVPPAGESTDPQSPPGALPEPQAEHRLYTPAAGEGFEVTRRPEGAFLVRGPRVERLIARHDPDNDEAMAYVEDRLRAIGVIEALQAAGFEPGDDVEIAGILFELDPAAPFR